MGAQLDSNAILSHTIDTERLILRPFFQEDAEAVASLADDFDISSMTLNMPHPYPVQAARLWLKQSHELINQGRLLQYALVTKHGGQLAGSITLKKRAPSDTEAELSYWLGKPYWAQGLAVEGARATLTYAAKSFDLDTVRAATIIGNQRSARVLLKLGFVPDGLICVWSRAKEKEIQLQAYRRVI